MSILTARTLISTHGASWNYPGCWHQMYPHINRSTWLKCSPNVKLMSCNVTLGHHSLPGSTGGGGMSNDRPAWPTGWPNGKLTWDACTEEVHLTEVHVATGLCDQCSHTHGHQISLHWGRVRLTFCLPAAIGQPASHVTRYQPVRLWVGQICGGRRTGSPTTLGPSPGSQHSHWFPFRSDLPDQGRASDTNELCSLFIYFWHCV